MITEEMANEPVSATIDAGNGSLENLRPASRTLSLDAIERDYGWRFTSVTDIWSEIGTASNWRELDNIRLKVLEFLDVDPPVLTRVDGDSLLGAVNSRLDSPPIGSAADWQRLSQLQQRAVRMLIDRIEEGPNALSLSPDQHHAIVMEEIERIARAGLPATMQAQLVDLLDRSLHRPAPGVATTRGESVPDKRDCDRTEVRDASPSTNSKRDRAAGCLSPWANDVRCFPRCLVRGALLRPIKSSPIYFGRITPIQSLGGILMSGRGRTLSQADLDVCLAALHLARRKPLGRPVGVTLADLIQAAGRTDGERTRTGVTASLRRISRFRFSVEVNKPAQEFHGTLLESVSVHRRRRDGRCCVSYVVPPDLLVLFSAGRVSVSFEQRKALAGHPIAGWLQMFIESHQRVHRISVTRYHKLTGLRCSIGEFRRLLKSALDKLVAVGVIASGSIEDDKVYITRVK